MANIIESNHANPEDFYNSLKEKLEILLIALKAADNEVDPVEACKKVKAEFGDDFPVPVSEDTAQAKMQIMRDNGINVVDSPADIGKTVAKVLG